MSFGVKRSGEGDLDRQLLDAVDEVGPDAARLVAGGFCTV
jgi:hypothetical protein